jgi:2-polyprenyl-3-methyl-5-hydroxy-6-metoxy-1,4-benzoquinol methylase
MKKNNNIAKHCPLCGSTKKISSEIILADSKKPTTILECKTCGLFYLADLHKSRTEVYGKNYSVWGADEKAIVDVVADSKRGNFKLLLKKLRRHMDFKGKSILDVGTGNGYLLEVAKDMGFSECYGLELSKSAAKIASKKFPGHIFNCEIGKLSAKQKFDVIALTDLVEHLPNIAKDFKIIMSHLKKGGYVIITTPNTDSFTRTLAGKKWYQYKFEHVVYFNKQSMRKLLEGFDIERLSNNTKSLKLAYYKSYMKKYVSPKLARLIPDALGKITIVNPILGELLVIAKKK